MKQFVSTWGALLAMLLVAPTPGALATGMMILDNPSRMTYGGFASAMTTVGDIDGDGVNDYLVGAYDHHVQYPPPAPRLPYPPRSLHQGRAFVFSGKSGTLVFTLNTPVPMSSAAFGFSVAGAGDVNGDGIPDLLIGAVGYEGSGKAFVFSGKDAKFLHTLQASQRQVGAGFGWAQCPLWEMSPGMAHQNYWWAHTVRREQAECSSLMDARAN